MSSVKVVVRVRPLNQREIDRGSRCVVVTKGPALTLSRPCTSSSQSESSYSPINEDRTFTYDNCYWSFDDKDPHYASQETVYHDIGRELLDHAFEGYNTCIFAYGQTGSGKSYSMMGYKEQRGLIPRACDELFARIREKQDAGLTYTVEVSYMEIYNEKVRDLLNINNGSLRVRESPSLGPYVEDLSKLVVASYEDIAGLMEIGNQARTVGATNMNASSSRSHAIFTIMLTQRQTDSALHLSSEKVSRICLVDLAGSERADATGATGVRLKEGANINKSLTTLGKVISALAGAPTSDGRRSSEGSHKRLARLKATKAVSSAPAFVPYRDSVLTWLLKDCLGGNSKTVMIAAISPADINYEETLSTLRYAERAKRIVNKAIVNEDANAKLMRDLQSEVAALRAKLRVYEPDFDNHKVGSDPSPAPIVDSLKDEIKANEKLLAQITQSYEEKLRTTQEIQQHRERALEELGISVAREGATNVLGVQVPKKVPHLVNLNEDPLMSECLLYQLPRGTHLVGDSVNADIRLSGDGILEAHCQLVASEKGVSINPLPSALVYVNGKLITMTKKLRSGNRLILGKYHVFRFNDPEQARQERMSDQSLRPRLALVTRRDDISGVDIPSILPSASTLSSELSAASGVVDWEFAQRERDGKTGLASPSSTSAGDGDDLDDRASTGRLHRNFIKQSSRRSFRLHDTLSVDGHMKASSGSSGSSPLMSAPEYSTAEAAEMENADERLHRMLEQQRRVYEEKLHKLTSDMSLLSGTDELTMKQQRIARQAIRQWKSRRFVRIWEELQNNIVLLKEAIVISTELCKGVTYRFILHTARAAEIPVSFWETWFNATPTTYYEPRHLPGQSVPNVLVQVLDARHDSINYWDLSTFLPKIEAMRAAYNVTNQSSAYFSTQAPSVDDVFYHHEGRRWFDLVGTAWVSIRSLLWGVTGEVQCDILDEMGRTVGWVQIVISVIGGESSYIGGMGDDVAEDSPNSRAGFTLQDGADMIFEVSVLAVGGIAEDQYGQIHVQFSSATFGLDESMENRVFATEPATDFGQGPARFDFCQAVRGKVTPRFREVITNGMTCFHVFGRRKNSLQSVLDMDTVGDISHPHRLESHLSSGAVVQNSRMQEQRHDILAQIQILEFSRATTDFKPSAVESSDRDTFLLRQGLQRKLALKLSHTCGRSLAWACITDVKIGEARIVNRKTGVSQHLSKDMISLQVPEKQEATTSSRRGTSALYVESEMPALQCLNTVTKKDEIVTLKVEWIAQMHDPEAEAATGRLLSFSANVAICVYSRDYRIRAMPRYHFSNLVSISPLSERLLTKRVRFYDQSSLVYTVAVVPKKRRALYSHQRPVEHDYVRGEECLKGWKPPCPTQMVANWYRSKERVSLRVDVERLRQGLLRELSHDTLEVSVPDDTRRVVMMKKVLELWRWKSLRDPELERLLGNRIGTANYTRDAHKGSSAEHWDILVTLVNPGPVAKQGYMYWPDLGDDTWVKRWFVVRRPHLYVYADAAEKDLLAVIGLHGVQVRYSKHLWRILQRSDVFALHTPYVSLLVQALDEADMLAWVSAMDPLHVAEVISSRGKLEIDGEVSDEELSDTH
ncbi:hypothetical protein BC832DRAFT_546541 [Gaertneriomyces semiglobifer]|nr:hypothetical protein BC832DRAFT_546541 [Gaertneriomyces semiglobifer]